MNSQNNKTPSPAVNLLSSVPPPADLPSFVLNQVPAQTQPQFNPVIPEKLAENFHPDDLPSSSTQSPPDAVQSPGSTSSNTSDFKKLVLNPEPVVKALAPLTNASTSLFGWVKGAADASGGLLQKIGEKAMNSMDTLVTTLDPQMKEYIRSGGDVEILIASGKEDKVRPIREAFQTVFGRATLTGVPMDPKEANTAEQPVGFEAVKKACHDRISQVRNSNGVGNKMPVIALENFLVEIYPDKWFDLGLIVLDEPDQGIYLETFTQMTPIPLSVAVALQSETPVDYEHKETGYSVPVGQVMGQNLQVAHSEWHAEYTGTKRCDLIHLAAITLATLYKNVIEEQDRVREGREKDVVVVEQQPQGGK